MLRKFFPLITLLLLIPNLVSAQYQARILKAPDTWQHEILVFPISFAPELTFSGFEELRFAPNWSDSTHEQFWTYTFVWFIQADTTLEKSNIVSAIKWYYDGLMQIKERHEDDHINDISTTCKLKKSKENWSGKIHLYDNFYTHQMMYLNVKISHYKKSETGMQLFQFKLSPKPFNHEVWNIFNEVEILPEYK